jgi:hypothetical protein
VVPDRAVPVEEPELTQRFRYAQANRVIRFLMAEGIDMGDVVSGRVELDLSAIKGPNGWVQPEDIDFIAADLRFNPPLS